MKLLPSSILFYLTTILVTTALPLSRRAADFPSVIGLTTLTHDFSRPTPATAPYKFFHEAKFSYHYDGRFASEPLPDSTRLDHLRLMLRAYTTTMARIGVRTWLMHGGLLGWWWGGKLMPWDTDLDYMVDEAGMAELGGWWNMSVHSYSYRDGQETTTDVEASDAEREESPLSKAKKYLLEINPQYTNTSTKDRLNRIDARWIDTSTGLFIDITTLHIQPYSTLAPKPHRYAYESPQLPSFPSSSPPPSSLAATSAPADPDIPLYTKDMHAYSSAQLFPLRLTTFEDTLTLVPFDYESVLLDEYGPDAVTQRWYRGWKFEKGDGWVRDEAEGGPWDRVEKGGR